MKLFSWLLSLGFSAPFWRFLLRFPAMILLSNSGVLTSIRKFPFIEGYHGGREEIQEVEYSWSIFGNYRYKNLTKSCKIVGTIDYRSAKNLDKSYFSA